MEDVVEKQQVNSMLKTATIEEQMQFLHVAAGYPVLSTWIKAIQKGYYISWPGLTANNVRRYLPKSPITARGHIEQLCKNTNSTKNLLEDENLEVEPQQTDDNIKTHQMFAAICEEGKIYTDQTGRFPQLSRKGTKYIMIIYVYDANAILTVGLKSRMAGELVKGYQSIYQYLQTKGYKPQVHWLDNECPKEIKAFNTTNDTKYQLTPPHMHRINVTERAICTFKKHFKTILSGTDPAFPMHLWCRLLKQATLTLNMLRLCCQNPTLSAAMALEGAHDYNAHPLGPMGCKITVHETVGQRATWGLNGIKGWYIGPTREHYRCY